MLVVYFKIEKNDEINYLKLLKHSDVMHNLERFMMHSLHIGMRLRRQRQMQIHGARQVFFINNKTNRWTLYKLMSVPFNQIVIMLLRGQTWVFFMKLLVDLSELSLFSNRALTSFCYIVQGTKDIRPYKLKTIIFTSCLLYTSPSPRDRG